jgi:hypothetical protein
MLIISHRELLPAIVRHDASNARCGFEGCTNPILTHEASARSGSTVPVIAASCEAHTAEVRKSVQHTAELVLGL